MKGLFTANCRKIIMLMLMVVTILNTAIAQLPDCASGNVMYAIFNDSTGSGAAKPSEIRSVNYATGAVGPAMGGAFTINRGAFYGSAAVGIDPITKRFYV